MKFIVALLAIFLIFIVWSSILRGKDEGKCATLGYPKTLFTLSGTFCVKKVNNTDVVFKLDTK